MQFLLLIYIDQTLLDSLPEGCFDAHMRDCFVKADALRDAGSLLGSQQLEDAVDARTLRTRKGQPRITDGPFAETKEVLGGFNLIEADDAEAALRIAQGFPWSQFGSIEIRPVRDMDAVRRRVGA